VTGIKKAIEQNRFILYAQSIVALASKQSPEQSSDCQRYEVLLRMIGEKDNVLPPGAFIPAAERYGLMGAIDRWVIAKVLADFSRLFDDSRTTEIAINLSGNSLNDATLFDFVKQQFNASALDPQQICFEITETTLISNPAQAPQFIGEMKELGCRFGLDDFGSGLSSFAYLKNLPVDYLKINGSFIRHIANDSVDCAIVSAINQVSHTLGIETIAESVENEATIEILRTLGIDYIQGYGVGKPYPLM
jgi:EAL domain-containing protein (putative c-di-GMP-specific phosphodiesterase class I)